VNHTSPVVGAVNVQYAVYTLLCTLEYIVVCVADIIKESLCSYCADDMPQFKTVVAFDCRGVEPTDFEPRVCWFFMFELGEYMVKNLYKLPHHAML